MDRCHGEVTIDMIFIRNGWTSAKKQFPIAILLFLYELLWGVFLYKIIQSAITPVLQRYPDPGPGELSRFLFLIEGQLGLSENPSLRLYAALLAGMVFLRLVLTPLIRAGIYHGLLEERERDGAGWLFFEGIRTKWKPVSIFYAGELLLSLAPAYWILPQLFKRLSLLLNGDQKALMYTAGLLLAWVLWAYAIKKCLEYMLLGWLSHTGMLSSLLWCIRRILRVISISVILGAASLIVFLLFTSASWFWTGLLGLILHQIYPFFRSFLGIWQTASQFHLWKTGTQK
ncbi:hypothetical protein [Paenibacillus caui]|uniref:hypothetical protein n=1 Tax=Paenibacillus caui TaxID=2873927 RepID=UPI001F314230|nr:hypothetical protein [Paenibacillus caui]